MQQQSIEAKIMTELSQLQEVLEEYKAQGEGERIKQGDYSGSMSNEDLNKKGIITKVTTTENVELGIVKSPKKIGLNTKLGQNGKNISDTWTGNMEDLSDVFAIDLRTNRIYYIDGKIWSKDGELEIADIKEENKDSLNIFTTDNVVIDLSEEPTKELLVKGDSGEEISKTNLTFKSANEEIAKVDENGLVTGISNGECKITVIAENGKQATTTVKVQTSPQEIIVTPKENTLNIGESVVLEVEYKPSTVNVNKGITWSSSNGEIAKVDKNGKVTGLQPGEVTITAETINHKKATSVVYVGRYELAVNPNGGKWNDTTEISTIKQFSGTKKDLGNAIPPAGYTVTFDGNGGTAGSTTLTSTKSFSKWTLSGKGSLNGTIYTFGNGAGTVTANYTNNSITLPTATRTGYTFNGWYDAATGGNKIGDAGAQYTPTESKTLYAQWTVNNYTVTYDQNYYANNILTGDTNINNYVSWRTTKTTTIVTDASVAKSSIIKNVFGPVTDTMNGIQFYFDALTVGKTYTYSVYLKASENKTIRIGPQQGGQANVNITTQWQKFTFTFTAIDNQYTTFIFYGYDDNKFDEGEELYIHSLEIMEGAPTHETASKTYNTQLGTLPTPAREGYTFKGWYTAPTGGTKISETTVVPANDVTYYAQWTANTYTVILRATKKYAGTSWNWFGEESYSCLYGTTFNISNYTNVFTVPTGYYYGGAGTDDWWNYNDTNSQYNYMTNSENGGSSAFTVTGNMVAQLHYYPITYTVKYNANGGTGSMSDSSYTYDESKALTANAFSRTGYIFSGWNTNSSGTGTSYSNSQSVANLTSTNGATVNLYAKWTPITYQVKYNANGGTGSMSNSSHTYNVAKNLTANAFSRSGYAFNGWNTKADGTGTSYSNSQSVTNLSSTNGAVVNLYAKWKDTTAPTCTITANVGSPVNTASITYTIKFSESVTGFTQGDITLSNSNYIFGVSTGLSSSFVLSGSATVPIVQSNQLSLSSGVRYKVEFDYKCASGTNQFNVDFYPDTLPQQTYTATTTTQSATWNMTSTHSDLAACYLRFFDDIQESSESDITISNLRVNACHDPSITSFSGSGATYTAVVTTNATNGSCTPSVSVAAGKCTDAAGNANIASNTVSILVDRRAPYTPSISTSVSGTSVTATASGIGDIGSGVKNVKFYLDGTLKSTSTSTSSSQSYTFTDVSTGSHTIKVEVIDNVGLSSSKSVTVQMAREWNDGHTHTFGSSPSTSIPSGAYFVNYRIQAYHNTGNWTCTAGHTHYMSTSYNGYHTQCVYCGKTMVELIALGVPNNGRYWCPTIANSIIGANLPT